MLRRLAIAALILEGVAAARFAELLRQELR
jgi:hypothetical protein